MKKRFLIYALAFSMLVSPAVFAKNKKPVLNHKKITISIGEQYRLKVKNKGKKTVKWSSTKKKTVSVNKKGVVTAKRKGTAKIRAKIAGKTLTCKVYVTKKKLESSSMTTSAPSAKPGSHTETTPPANQNNHPSSTQTPRPDNGTKATPNPDSIVNKPVEDPKTKDDGWVPGWY